MKEEYVPYPLAVALKAAGFDVLESDNAYYIHSWMQEPKLVPLEDAMFEESQYDGTDVYPAPRLDQAQRWLREVKGIHVEVNFRGGNDYEVYGLVNYRNFPKHVFDLWDYDKGIVFHSYESALSAGIAKALEILNENKQ